MSVIQQIVRLGMELGLAVNDYNSCITETYDEIINVTLAYLIKVKEAVQQGLIPENELTDYFALVGQSWGSIRGRQDNPLLNTTPVFVKRGGGDAT